MFKPPYAQAIGLLVTATLLSACGGGTHSGTIPTVNSPGGGQPTVASATATFAFTFPKAKTSGVRRMYLSPSTKSITVQVTDTKLHGTLTDIFANVPAGLKAVQVANFANLTGNPNAPGQCGTDPSNAGNYKCTATYQLPVGDNSITIASWDANGGTGNKLSEQTPAETTYQGIANNYTVSLDANAATMTLSGTQACTTGSVGATFGTVGTTPVTMSLKFTDADGATIVAPGLPLIQVKDNTATYQSANGTINGTGGTVSFSINQSAQTITFTPSAAPITNVSVNIQGVQPGVDGLSFTLSKSFTLSVGVAPPSSFLGVIEQLGTNSGRIDLYTVSLGTSDTFTPYTVTGGGTYLATTNSINETKPDIDNPRAMLFDSNGNLLIANGGQGGAGGDYGDLACVPAGSISTGAAVSTTSSTNARDPESLEIGTDNSVAMGNVPASATYNTVGYTLGSVYTAAPLLNITNSTSVGTLDVVSLPTLTAGTYAAAITNGTTTSRVVIKAPSGTETNIVDSTIYSPQALGWDAANSQLVIGSQVNAGGQAYLDFYSVSGVPAKVKSVIIRNDGGGNSLLEADKLAVSPNGTVAVGGIASSGLPDVQIFDNTANRNATALIPFDACDSSCTTYYYGTNTIITSLKFLSNTKLLVTLSTSSAPTKQGVYIFDLTQSAPPCDGNPCYDPYFLTPYANGPKKTGFQVFTTNPPLGAAYKP